MLCRARGGAPAGSARGRPPARQALAPAPSFRAAEAGESLRPEGRAEGGSGSGQFPPLLAVAAGRRGEGSPPGVRAAAGTGSGVRDPGAARAYRRPAGCRAPRPHAHPNFCPLICPVRLLPDSQVGRSPGSTLPTAPTPNTRPVWENLLTRGSLPRLGAYLPKLSWHLKKKWWDLGQIPHTVTQSHQWYWNDGVHGHSPPLPSELVHTRPVASVPGAFVSSL